MKSPTSFQSITINAFIPTVISSIEGEPQNEIIGVGNPEKAMANLKTK